MKLTKIAAILAVALGTSACVSSNNASQNLTDVQYTAAFPTTDKTTATQQLGIFAQPQDQQQQLTFAAVADPTSPVISQFDVVDVFVNVPEYLVVSEADVYLPQADIVWREDPIGDRREQVKTIMQNAITLGTAPLNGSQKVIISVRMNMFHAITEKARNSVGGKHNVQFDYVLLDAETKQPITGVRNVDASLKAFGGSRAYRAMRRGETQKVRISRHVGDLLRKELSLSAS